MTIEIYGTEWCTACKQAKFLCEMKSLEYSYTDVGDASAMIALENRLGQKVKAVPQIFLDGNHLPNGYLGLQEAVKSI